MRDLINRNNVIAEENVRLTGHPAKEKVELWTTEIRDKSEDDLDDIEGKRCKAPESEASRQQKIDAINKVIDEDLDR